MPETAEATTRAVAATVRPPPRPFATFEPHAGANGIAFSADAAFGFEGEAFVCEFGDLNPNTTRQPSPSGYKIVRVDMRTGDVHDFAVNRIIGPASKLPHDGFERLIANSARTARSTVTDWGDIDIAPEAGGVRMQIGSGTLWRIRRVRGASVSVHPPAPPRVPLYAFLFYIPLLLVLAAVGVGSGC